MLKRPAPSKGRSSKYAWASSGRPVVLSQEKRRRATEVAIELAIASSVFRAESICCLATERPSCWKVWASIFLSSGRDSTKVDMLSQRKL